MNTLIRAVYDEKSLRRTIWLMKIFRFDKTMREPNSAPLQTNSAGLRGNDDEDLMDLERAAGNRPVHNQAAENPQLNLIIENEF